MALLFAYSSCHGLSIYARAYERSSKVIQMNSKWDPNDFSQLLNKSHATRCSLVPAQLYDIVNLWDKASHDIKITNYRWRSIRHTVTY